MAKKTQHSQKERNKSFKKERELGFRLESVGNLQGIKKGEISAQPYLLDGSLLLQRETLEAKGEGCR